MNEKDKPTVLLEYYLKKLRLPTMLREYVPMSAVCRDERSDFPIYLLRLSEREILDREKRAAERRIKEARFPVVKTIDTFDFNAQPSINEQLVRGLMRSEYIDKRENILLIGNSGTGKTHLACALAFAACAMGRKVRFAKKDTFKGFRNNCKDYTLSSLMNSGMCPFPRPELSFFSIL
jgi:DNA replication protein DnaC